MQDAEALEKSGEEQEGRLKKVFGNDKVYDEFISLLSEATVDDSGAISCAMSWDKELFMLKGGKLPHGVIVSSMRLLVMNLHEAMKLEESGGTVLDGRPLYGLNLESDGKRKLLLNGWNFQSLGAHTHTHTRARARARTHTHLQQLPSLCTLHGC